MQLGSPNDIVNISDFGDSDRQSLGSSSNAVNHTVAYDIFKISSEGDDEEPPDRVEFGGPYPDIVQGFGEDTYGYVEAVSNDLGNKFDSKAIGDAFS